MEGAASTHSALFFTMGISAYLGVLHVWLWRRTDPAHLWVALWCVLAVGYQASRWVQFQTDDAGVAVAAARTTVAVAPLLVASLACFARTLEDRPVAPFAAAVLAGAVVLAGISLGTPLLVAGQVDPRVDWFGRRYLGAPVSSFGLVLAPVIVGAVAYVLRVVRRTPRLHGMERAVLLGCLGVYAAMGLASLLSALRWLSIPTVAEFGPIVVGLGLNYLLVRRHRRLQDHLQQMVHEHTARLADSEARYRGLVENAPVGVLACDLDGALTAVNARMLEIVGSPRHPEEIHLNVLTYPPLVRSGAAGTLARCMREQTALATEHRYTSRYGRTVEVRLTAAPLHDEDGGVAGALGIVEEVGERKALERRVRQSQRLESVGQLTAGLAHEINNPLAYVRANLTLLRKEWEGLRNAVAGLELQEPLQEGDALIDESLEGVERVAGIVRDMRDFSRAADEDRGPCDLNAVVEGSVRMASTWRRAHTRIEEDYAALPPVPGAEGQLRQVVLNLVVNALQAVEADGRVAVSTAQEGDHAVVRVADDGCGIPEENLDRLFDPFFTTKPAGEGTGLGLYVSYEIVRSHGGEIRVRSEPGRGAVFELRLPARGPLPEDAAP